MSVKKFSILITLSVISFGFILLGCEADSSYEHRTVVYVSNINEGAPFTSDVLNQGDSLYYTETMVYKLEDDFIHEDWVTVEFTNKPYNTVTNIASSNHGDFLVTGYTVEYQTLDGSSSPVSSFSGDMSLLVPANGTVKGAVMLVPFRDKNTSPLVDMQYSTGEILTNANITFRGHEIQTDYEFTFSCGLFVGFADILNNEEN